jgi:hypothetical protein
MENVFSQLAKMPQFSEVEPPRDNSPAEESYYAFLKKEQKQYTRLHNLINDEVVHTVKVLTGVIAEDKQSTHTFESVQANLVPLTWVENCYPSFRTYTTFIDNLV